MRPIVVHGVDRRAPLHLQCRGPVNECAILVRQQYAIYVRRLHLLGYIKSCAREGVQ